MPACSLQIDLNMSNSKPLPIDYHLQVYEGSFSNYPVWVTSSLGPFPAIARGDEFGLGIQGVPWESPPGPESRHIVKEVSYSLAQIGDSFFHQLNVCVVLEARPVVASAVARE